MSAHVHFRFRVAMRTGNVSREDVLRMADVELADVITTLPTHLQPDETDSECLRILQAMQPWIKWQRFSVALVLLHLRMRMHCSLRMQWNEDDDIYGWAKTVAIESASRIIWITYNWDQPAETRNQWYYSTVRRYLCNFEKLTATGHYLFMSLAQPPYYLTNCQHTPPIFVTQGARRCEWHLKFWTMPESAT